MYNIIMKKKLEKYFALLIKDKTQLNFEKVYLITAPPLYRLAVKIVHNEDVAQEVIQDAFIKIWNNIETYNPTKGKPLHWITSIVRNQAIDYIRKQKTILIVDDFEIDSIASDANQEDENLQHKEKVLELNECIGELEQNSKDAIFMAYYSNMTYENISKTLGFPVNTVKTWVRRSKAFISRCLKNKQKMLESLKS